MIPSLAGAARLGSWSLAGRDTAQTLDNAPRHQPTDAVGICVSEPLGFPVPDGAAALASVIQPDLLSPGDRQDGPARLCHNLAQGVNRRIDILVVDPYVGDHAEMPSPSAVQQDT